MTHTIAYVEPHDFCVRLHAKIRPAANGCAGSAKAGITAERYTCELWVLAYVVLRGLRSSRVPAGRPEQLECWQITTQASENSVGSDPPSLDATRTPGRPDCLVRGRLASFGERSYRPPPRHLGDTAEQFSALVWSPGGKRISYEPHQITHGSDLMLSSISATYDGSKVALVRSSDRQAGWFRSC